jgi:hypothetical protein
MLTCLVCVALKKEEFEAILPSVNMTENLLILNGGSKESSRPAIGEPSVATSGTISGPTGSSRAPNTTTNDWCRLIHVVGDPALFSAFTAAFQPLARAELSRPKALRGLLMACTVPHKDPSS